MAKFELMDKQKEQLNKLISMLIYYSKFSPPSRSPKPWLVKVPLSRLQETDITFSEAKGLLQSLYKIVDSKEAYTQVLNGIIGHDGGRFYVWEEDVMGGGTAIDVDGIDDKRDIEENLIVWVYNPKGIREGVESFLGSPILKYAPASGLKERAAPDENCWITKDGKGNYHYDGVRAVIKDSGTEYMQIFNAVFALLPQGGSISYGKIEERCKAQSRLKIDKKKIQRALTGKDANFFRWVKNVPHIAPNGESFFIANKKGTTLKFNNQK